MDHPSAPASTADAAPQGATSQGENKNLSRRPRPHTTGSRIYWSALAVGSVAGIASWALLYTLGAAVAWQDGRVVPSAALGLYGAVAAAIALAEGSFVASRAGRSSGAGDEAVGVLYGVTMAGMANITLVATACALDAGWANAAPPLFGGLLAVGACTLAMVGAPGEVPTSLHLWAMAAVMVLSLALGAAGGRLGAQSRR